MPWRNYFVLDIPSLSVECSLFMATSLIIIRVAMGLEELAVCILEEKVS